MTNNHGDKGEAPERDDVLSEGSDQISNDTDKIQANKEALLDRTGCLKGCLLPILFVVVVVSVLAFGLYNRRDVLHRWIFKRIISNIQSQVLHDLPKDLDRKHVEEVFKRVREAFDEGKLDEEAAKDSIDSYLTAVELVQAKEQRKAEIEKLLIGLEASIISKPPRRE